MLSKNNIVVSSSDLLFEKKSNISILLSSFNKVVHYLEKCLYINRLGKMRIHSGFYRCTFIFFKCIRRHSHDRNSMSTISFSSISCLYLSTACFPFSATSTVNPKSSSISVAISLLSSLSSTSKMRFPLGFEPDISSVSSLTRLFGADIHTEPFLIQFVPYQGYHLSMPKDAYCLTLPCQGTPMPCLFHRYVTSPFR